MGPTPRAQPVRRRCVETDAAAVRVVRPAGAPATYARETPMTPQRDVAALLALAVERAAFGATDEGPSEAALEDVGLLLGHEGEEDEPDRTGPNQSEPDRQPDQTGATPYAFDPDEWANTPSTPKDRAAARKKKRRARRRASESAPALAPPPQLDEGLLRAVLGEMLEAERQPPLAPTPDPAPPESYAREPEPPAADAYEEFRSFLEGDL